MMPASSNIFGLLPEPWMTCTSDVSATLRKASSLVSMTTTSLFSTANRWEIWNPTSPAPMIMTLK